jgi:integral membrane protein
MIGLMRAAIFEALTLLALFCVAMPLKYFAGVPQLVSVMGPIHGLAFVIFLWFVIRSWAEGLISWPGATRLFVGAMIPFGGFVNERWLRRKMEQK